MLFRLYALSLCVAASGASLTTTCIDTLGVVTLTWTGAVGNPQIHVGSATGPAMTGVLPATGTAVTGPWVSYGLSFYLVDQSGTVEASAIANTNCSTLPQAVDQGLASGGYFPLAVGNTWVYKYSDRLITSSYVVQTITAETYQAGQIYYVLNQTEPPAPLPIAMLRADSSGVIYQLTSSGEQVYLDPESASPAAAYTGALGVFNDTLVTISNAGGLILTNSTFARGIGLVGSQSTMLSGSSGGFTESLDLVDVKVNGFHLSVPQPKISLSVDNPNPNISNKLAPNCAVPCYFVACNLTPGADPPNTYRPCGQVRVDASAVVPFYDVLVELLDSTGKQVFQYSAESLALSSQSYVRLPLYTGQTPFTPLPAGTYNLVANLQLGTTTLASSTILMQIQ